MALKMKSGPAGKCRESVGPKSSANAVQVRMYCHGLGDCFLVRFRGKEGARTTNVLIDCGLIGVAKDPRPIMQRVVDDIRTACDNHIDLAIVTHEHWDHVSGFSTQQAQERFADDALKIDHVWYAWTEDPSPSNKLGRRLREERAAKAEAVHRAALALGQMKDQPFAVERARRVAALMSFFGYDQEMSEEPHAPALEGAIGKTRAAFDYLARRRGTKVRYCRPADPPQSLPGTDGVRVYVLGPPEDEGMLKRSAPTKKGAEVYELSGDLTLDDQLKAAFDRLAGSASADADDRPFENSFGRDPDGTGIDSPDLQRLKQDTWDREPWRQISHDWTAAIEALALDLDTHTNNTGLVVAFELTRSGRVLLFAADAQVGNWLSWQNVEWEVPDGPSRKVVKGPDLLARTVFYKVGHHGSHNATLRAQGLEQMVSDELVAFIPVDKQQAEKNRWHEMPFEPLVKRLREKTAGRLVMSDKTWKKPGARDLKSLSEKEQRAFVSDLTSDDAVEPLYWELAIAD